jgi:hypothetical protein
VQAGDSTTVKTRHASKDCRSSAARLPLEAGSTTRVGQRGRSRLLTPPDGRLLPARGPRYRDGRTGGAEQRSEQTCAISPTVTAVEVVPTMAQPARALGREPNLRPKPLSLLRSWPQVRILLGASRITGSSGHLPGTTTREATKHRCCYHARFFATASGVVPEQEPGLRTLRSDPPTT